MRNETHWILTCGSATLALSAATAASCQEAPSPPPVEANAPVSTSQTSATAAGAQDNDAADIVVTAQRRSERLLDVPLSIAAISQAQIEQQGIRGIEDFTARVAGLHLSRDSSQSSFTVRGISASATGADTTSATAGFYLDDYPLYDTWFRFSSPDIRIFDVQRIEVLRGPQGTLYGATSLSGSIRVIANKPDLTGVAAEFAGTLGSVRGGNATYDADAMINLPLSDKVGIRAVGYVRQDGGYIDAPLFGGRNTNDQRTYGGRFYLRAKPSDTLDLLASVTYQHDAQDDQSATYYFPPAGRNDYQWGAFLPSKTRSSLLISTVSATQQIGGGALTLTGIYAENKSQNEFDGTPVILLFGRALNPAFAPVPTAESRPSNSDTKIVEARYTSDATKPLRFTLGAYYNTRFREFRQAAAQDALFPPFGTSRVYLVYASQKATELAGFGEATWAFAPRWEFTAGVRVFHNAYDFYGEVSGLINNIFDPLTVNKTNVSNAQTSATPRFSLSYKPDPNVNLYATASQGYRFGLSNYNSGARSDTPLTYKSDKLWNYEVGVKSSLWGGRATLNTSLFYIDWTDIQLPFPNSNGQIYITNAGDARSYGLETELTVRPSAALELNASVSGGHAEITRGDPTVIRRVASIRGPQVLGTLKGDQLPGSQNFSASGGIQYNFGTIGSGTPYVRVDDIYVGPSYTDFLKSGSLRTGDYNLVNLRIGYRSDRFELTAFADNLFSSHGIVSAIPNADRLGTDAAFRVRPRTIGATLRVRR